MPESTEPAYRCRHCKTSMDSLIGPRPSSRWSEAEGLPFPFGVTWLPAEQAYNFALYSRHAQTVELLFFQQDNCDRPTFAFQFDALRNKSGPVWHCHIPVSDVNDARYYAYRIGGPNNHDESTLHAFDQNKILLDPYARTVYFPPAFDRSAAMRSGSNMGQAPVALLDECQCRFEWDDDKHVRRESDLIIYEMHVRGFTQDCSSGLPPERRGTFQGVIDKIPYLSELGVTAVELMPVFQFDPQDGNYWGYMPLTFFAPHHGYAMSADSCAQRSEFRRMVQALHAAGIEVILDVVFNHSCEGNSDGPTYSFKGIDNATYYLLSEDSGDGYVNFSGCGNTLRTANAPVRQLVVDSLRYWATEMHVDGFRFDLASVFTRNSDGAVNFEDPPIFAEIAGDPELADVRLIAEPWDAGGAFLLGQQFPGNLWMQWNSRYRDSIQRFVRGDPGLVGELMTRLYGSCDLFPDDLFHSLRPRQSLNYVTSHDGSTMYDLVAYDHHHNEANGHGNSDGATEFGHNCGVEGDIDVRSDVMRLRKQRVKNFCCLLMLSNGTPMFRMGDEFLQTQGGNNNPYNQDNETSWLDWGRFDQHHDVFRFFREMIAFRKAHVSIARSQFWRDDVQWFGPGGPVELSESSRSLAFLLKGHETGDADLYAMINASESTLRFRIPNEFPREWKPMINTALESPHDISANEPLGETLSEAVDVAPHAIIVLQAGAK